jgi:hypothetical protein
VVLNDPSVVQYDLIAFLGSGSQSSFTNFMKFIRHKFRKKTNQIK